MWQENNLENLAFSWAHFKQHSYEVAFHGALWMVGHSHRLLCCGRPWPGWLELVWGLLSNLAEEVPVVAPPADIHWFKWVSVCVRVQFCLNSLFFSFSLMLMIFELLFV